MLTIRYFHTYLHTAWDPETENKIDPDDGNSWGCSFCLLPIFSTPFLTTGSHDHINNPIRIHDRCADELPPILKGHTLHPKDLILQHRDPSRHYAQCSCTRCGSTCGSRFYECPGDSSCRFRLDLPCAMSVTILHRSHEHRLTATRGRTFSFCSACGSQHQPPRRNEWVLYYTCAPCDFWIHSDCALLPNAIIVGSHHTHPMLLLYFKYGSSTIWCEICNSTTEDESKGCYACVSCKYYVHIKCAINSDPDSFKTVFIRDAQVGILLRLPMANEHTSVMACIKENNTYVCGNASASNGGYNTSTDHNNNHPVYESILHRHPLIPRNADGVSRICNVCLQLIAPFDPYYTCINNDNTGDTDDDIGAPCRDFVLHCCCVHLPSTSRNSHPLLNNGSLSLESKLDMDPFECPGCSRRCNGPFYRDEKRRYLRVVFDVVCASMPGMITHDEHEKTHILFMQTLIDPISKCNCCGGKFSSEIYYECINCRNFFIHAKCALLPKTVRHKFDRHPLQLVSTTVTGSHLAADEEDDRGEQILCEICESSIDKRYWYYGCDQCDNSFHPRCIPYFDDLSMIKFGYTVRVECHDCPVACVRATSVDGYKCGHCGEHIRESDNMAFECSKCYYRMHKGCVKKLVGKN